MKTPLSQEPAKYLSTLLSTVQCAILGVLHELGEFVCAEGNVWASKAQVMEASNKRSILGWGR